MTKKGSCGKKIYENKQRRKSYKKKKDNIAGSHCWVKKKRKI